MVSSPYCSAKLPGTANAYVLLYSIGSSITKSNRSNSPSKVLKDDKQLFPPYQGAPLLRKETAKRYPEIVKALNKLAGRITDEEMREMNYQVNVKGINPYEVARSYLEKENLLK